MSGHHRWSDLRDNKRFLDEASVNRHLGLTCMCPLIDCCHNEDQEPCGGREPHVHSGSPVSGCTQPWAPGDDSRRDSTGAVGALMALVAANTRAR